MPSSRLATQTEPPPAATAPGPRPTAYCAVIRPPSGSISADGVLVDAGQAVRLEHADDAEREDAREQQRGRRPTSSRARAPRRRRRGADGRGSRAAARQVERRVLREDRLVQPPQLGAGLDADLLDERRARVAVGLERLGLAPGAVQREHPLRVQPLAQRVLGDERLELADHLGVPAGREVGVDRHLGRAQPQLLEPADLGGGERLVGDVGQRLAAPQRERLARRAPRSSSRSKRTASTSPSASCSS